jgi:cyclase
LAEAEGRLYGYETRDAHMRRYIHTGGLTACVVVLCVAAAARAQQPTEPPFTIKQVGANVWAAIHNPKAESGALANAGFVIGSASVAVIDTFANAEAGRLLLAEIRQRTKLPVKFVVNTHYHFDHVAGNNAFVESGVVVLAQRNVRGWIHPENLRLFGADIKPEQKAFIERIAAPTLGYEQAVDLDLGDREIQVRSFPGHTGGDSVVLIPDARTGFAGDLFWRSTVPNTMDASVAPWINTLATLAKNAAGYTFVPGHGDVGNTQDIVAFRDYLATLLKLVADARNQGKSGNALVQAVMPALADKYGHWDFFKFLAERNISETDAELAGKKRIPQAPAQR